METIDQQVINDNKEIYAKIQSELIKARSEILIATAWFTDEELFTILFDKLDQGVLVEVIIADNQENEKLDFSRLAAKGAEVYKIKNVGYGIMNQKFCVIDKHIALHGSYNWTVNAKKNNHESIISTNHQDTITSLIENFNNIKTRILELKGESPLTDRVPTPKIDKPKTVPFETVQKVGAEFEKVLDSMIAAEVGSFDRRLLREQGFERSKLNSGDHQVLYKSFDTVYSVFINDIDVIEDKKKRLLSKIDEHRVKSIDSLHKNCELTIDYLQQQSQLQTNNFENQKTNLEAEVDINNKNSEAIKINKIPSLEQQTNRVDQQIKNLEREFLTPKIKWYEMIPTLVFNGALLCYIFVFYSSAAYILLFSVADAKEAEAQNTPIAVPQIFNAHAISNAWNKGWMALLFICLFVFIPLSFAAADRLIKTKWVTLTLFWVGIIVLDGAVAYKVTQAIYDVNYARGNVNVPWQKDTAFTDTNFYLVFVFGAMGLLMFKFAFKKLMQSFDDRNPDIVSQRNQVLIKQLQGQINVDMGKIMAFKDEILNYEKNNIQHKADIKHANQELNNLPMTLSQDLQKKRSQLITDMETIDKIASIYTVHIQSDNIPISVDALKDRINIFLEGWNDFLYQEYAIPRAALKTAQAAEIAILWQSEKLQTNKVDKRVKFNTSE